MLSDINSMSEAVERFQTVSNQQEFKTALYALQNYMNEKNWYAGRMFYRTGAKGILSAK